MYFTMKYKTIIIFILIFPAVIQVSASERFNIRGYMKAMPGMRITRDFNDADFDNIFHNRLNARLEILPSFDLYLEGRNRIFYNKLFNEFPFLADILETDAGLVDLSRVWMRNGAWVGHSEIDRLFLDYRNNNWQFRAGRQRINWGINLVSNPNDLFNTYSFFEVDYEERPGADALRVQYNMAFASRLDLAYKPAKNSRETVAAMLWSTNFRGYDFQAIAGYYYHRAAAGIGWAGNIGGAGFKGEGTLFYHLEEIAGTDRTDLVCAAGLDYMFGNGTFALIEFLYNGGYKPLSYMSFFTGQPLRADNIMFSEYAVTLSLQHSFSPILNGTIALMSLPDQKSFFISPSVSRSLLQNLDISLLSQIFLGGKETIFYQIGSAWYASLKYSF
jgi:hypothetical protein